MQSALGELFDHGLDAMQICIQAYIICSTLQLGASLWTYSAIIVLYITAYLLIWEDYVTDELRFGEYNSPTEALVIVIAALISTAVLGTSFWTTNIATYFNLKGFSLNHAFVLFGICAATSACIPR